MTTTPPAGGYQPMTIARLGELLAIGAEDERWLMISEFLEEHRHEPRERRLALLQSEPPPTGNERWDVFLAALAEYLAAKDGRRGPRWCEQRPAAFRRRGVMVAHRWSSIIRESGSTPPLRNTCWP